ncbi:MAG: guanylate kinase [Candidatus Gastranaerophilaceae bacterium]
MAGRLFIISGSSGVGKGTIIKEFLKNADNLVLSVSSTTRKPREGEVHGVNYFYITRDEFEKDVKDGKFIEWAEFGGNLYGTNKNRIQEVLDSGKNILLEIEVQGAKQVKEKMPEAVLIFILPPSREELENRLRGRGTETEEAIQKRLAAIAMESQESEHYDYKVVNDILEQAVEEVGKIYEANKG